MRKDFGITLAFAAMFSATAVWGWNRAQVADQVHADLRMLDGAVEDYIARSGGTPPFKLEQIVQTDGGAGGLARLPLDPWGRPYGIAPAAGGYCVYSLGADGRPSGSGKDQDHRWLAGRDACRCSR